MKDKNYSSQERAKLERKVTRDMGFKARFVLGSEVIGKLEMQAGLADFLKEVLPAEYHSSLFITKLRVKNSYRQRGYGRRLLEQAKLFASEQSGDIVLFVSTFGKHKIPLEEVEKFYGTCGFNQIESCKCFYYWRRE